MKEKLALIDCQKSLLYCKRKKNLIAFTDDKCGCIWQTRGKDFAVCLLFKNSSHSANTFPLHVIKNNFLLIMLTPSQCQNFSYISDVTVYHDLHSSVLSFFSLEDLLYLV